jgi:pimeloyl-ACP methyl ester carboxylesterase
MSMAAACSTGKRARADAPAIVLLHGFPASSFMFRDLIPLLADQYHLIASGHLGSARLTHRPTRSSATPSTSWPG